jgi:hypothetical protein
LQTTGLLTTHFGVREGLVYSHIPAFPLGGTILDLNLSGLEQDLDVQARLAPWLAVFITAAGFVVTGVDVGSLILGGGQFSAGGDAGALFRLWRNESSGTQIAMRLFGGILSGRDVSVASLIQALSTNAAQTLVDVVNGNIGKYVLIPTQEFHGGGSLHIAQAFNPFVSLQASIEARYIQQTTSPFDPIQNANVDDVTTTFQVAPAVALGLDGAPAGFPLGALLEYQLVGASTTSHYVAAGLYYTGRRWAQVGVTGLTQLGAPTVTGVDASGNPAPSGSPALYGGEFVLRTIW